MHGARAARRLHRHDLRVAAGLADGLRTGLWRARYRARRLCGHDGDASIARWAPRARLGHASDARVGYVAGRAGLRRRRDVGNALGFVRRARHLGKRFEHATSTGFGSSCARVWAQRSRAAERLQLCRRPWKIRASCGYLASDHRHAVAPCALGNVDHRNFSRGRDCTFSPFDTSKRAVRSRSAEPEQQRFALGLLTAVHDRRTRHRRAHGLVDLSAIPAESERHLAADDGHRASRSSSSEARRASSCAAGSAHAWASSALCLQPKAARPR
ncbi:hypothetical protein ABIE53_001477 [Burkholderia sp. OAS925]